MSKWSAEIVHGKDLSRLAIACVNCRNRKIKCDGQKPCSNCENRKIGCEYAPPKKRGPKRGTVGKLNHSGSDQYSLIQSILLALNDENQLSKHVQLVKKIQSSSSSGVVFNTLEVNEGDKQISDANEGHFLNMYFQCLNPQLPIVDETEFKSGLTTLSCGRPSFLLQYNAAIALGARVCRCASQAQQYATLARFYGKEVFDEPSREAISGFTLLGYYNLATGELNKGYSYTTLAVQMCEMLPISDDYRKILMVLQAFAMKNDGPFDWDIKVSNNNANMKFFWWTSKAILMMCRYRERTIHQDEILHLVTQAREVISTVEGPPTNFEFLNDVLLYGITAWMYWIVGDIAKAKEEADRVTCIVMQHSSMMHMGCPIVAIICLQVTRIHLKTGQHSMFTFMYEMLQNLATTWSFIEFPVQRLSKYLNVTDSHPAASKMELLDTLLDEVQIDADLLFKDMDLLSQQSIDLL